VLSHSYFCKNVEKKCWWIIEKVKFY